MNFKLSTTKCTTGMNAVPFKNLLFILHIKCKGSSTLRCIWFCMLLKYFSYFYLVLQIYNWFFSF